MHSPQSKEDAVPAASSTSIFTRIERAIGFVTAGVAGTLVVVETLLLFAGVLARYVYRKPLVWSDELASILFLWLAMLGAVIEGIPAIVLFGPLLFPIARQLGIHDIQYSMVVILAMGIGLFAPPFGVGYYAACAIGRVDPSVAFKPIWPYLAAMTIGLILVAAIPWFSIGFL